MLEVGSSQVGLPVSWKSHHYVSRDVVMVLAGGEDSGVFFDPSVRYG